MRQGHGATVFSGAPMGKEIYGGSQPPLLRAAPARGFGQPAGFGAAKRRKPLTHAQVAELKEKDRGR